MKASLSRTDQTPLALAYLNSRRHRGRLISVGINSTIGEHKFLPDCVSILATDYRDHRQNIQHSYSLAQSVTMKASKQRKGLQ